jgi:hypothetical protein
MTAVLNFLGYAVVTLFLILVCVLLFAVILAVAVLGFLAIRNLWREWRMNDGKE